MKTKAMFAAGRPAGVALRLAALFATTYVLVATSEPYGWDTSECLHLREAVSFDVAGTCGAPGIITVVSEEDECGIAVVGAAAAGLPAGGSFDVTRGENDTSLLRSPWTLSGYLTPARLPQGEADGGAADAAADGGGANGDGGGDGGWADVNSEVGSDVDGGSDAAAADAGPEVAVVPVPGGRAPGLGETRECKVTFGAKGPEALVCRPAGQNMTSRPDCTALLTRRP
jgi:hypothetical protein